MKRGFTIVEIFIVLAIVGILIAIAIPCFTKAREEAQKERRMKAEGWVKDENGEWTNPTRITEQLEGLFGAWAKHTGDPKGLSFEEWRALYESGMLKVE